MLPNVFSVLRTSRACRGHIRLLCCRWVYTNSVRSLSLTIQLYKKMTHQTFFIKDAEKGLWRFILKQDLKKECP